MFHGAPREWSSGPQPKKGCRTRPCPQLEVTWSAAGLLYPTAAQGGHHVPFVVSFVNDRSAGRSYRRSS